MSVIQARGEGAVGGFTLVEVLVALIILSIGVLGVARLTLVATRANDSAYLRTQATELAYQALDAMRGNRSSALAGDYQIALGAAPAYPPAPDCNAVPCGTPSNVANYDVSVWKNRLQNSLPNGDGSITTVTAGGETTATISVQWDDRVASSTFGQSAPGVAANTQVVLETVL